MKYFFSPNKCCVYNDTDHVFVNIVAKGDARNKVLILKSLIDSVSPDFSFFISK